MKNNIKNENIINETNYPILQNLKINFHLIEKCNFNCKFCFGKYSLVENLSIIDIKKIIKKIGESNIFSSINFAGGEPFLLKSLPELVSYAKSFGLFVSIITNASLLNPKNNNNIKTLNEILPYLDYIGFSFHSLSKEIHKKIGFFSNINNEITTEYLKELIEVIRSKCKIKIKINTVVNSLNKNEDLSQFIESLKIDRWKVLRCQEFHTKLNNNSSMLISDNEWLNFCQRHKNVKNIVFENSLKNSYIMINPQGNLIQNFENNYQIIGSVLNEDLNKLIIKLPLSIETYYKRYQI